MTKEKFSSMLDRLADAWTNREYEKVVEHFASELFYSDPLNYSFRGNSELLEFFRNDDGMLQSCTFHNSVFDETRQVGTAEYTYKGTFQYHGTVWIELKDDKIVSWREYQHKTEKSWKEFWNQ